MMDIQKPKQNNYIPAMRALEKENVSPAQNRSIIKEQKPFEYWLKKNRYYHQEVIRFYRFTIPKNATILQINCKNGYLLNELAPSIGVGIDEDVSCITQAQERYPTYRFYQSTLSNLSLSMHFDYIILSLATMESDDIQNLFTSMRRFCHERTRIVIDFYSYLWEPVLRLTQTLGLRRPTEFKNWISGADLQNFLHLSGFEIITHDQYMLMPMYVPLVSFLCNKVIINVPLINRLALHECLIARPIAQKMHAQELSVSVVIPCRNERGNVEQAILRCPLMGKSTELIFVEGNSRDGTLEEIERVASAYPNKNISWYVQDGKGKGDAVRKGFAHAHGDILMILDGDLTVPPEELSKFFDAIIEGKGEFINGSRLVYGMENGAMRFLNLLANYFFSTLFSWLLNQKVKDTLCGTKVLMAKDYAAIAHNRHFFGNFDPFGDFDLLFGAAKLNFKIIDLPVHYKSRTYGTSQIRRFMHGWILLGMSLLALKKFKFK